MKFFKNINYNILQNRLDYNKIASTVKAPNIYYLPVDILGSAAKKGVTYCAYVLTH